MMEAFPCQILQSWNAYLGRLPSQKLCPVENIENREEYTPNINSTLSVASAFVDFDVSSEVLGKEDYSGTLFVAVLSGTELKTQIRSTTSSLVFDVSLLTTCIILQIALLINALMTKLRSPSLFLWMGLVAYQI